MSHVRPRRIAVLAATGLAIAAAALCAICAVGPAVAGADSIVYAKDGNVWLSTPDATAQYQVTFDGGWSSPSQDDSGTIVAQRAGTFVRMTRSGRPIGAPVAVVGGAGGLNVPGAHLFGPYDPRVSPDGARIAYWFVAQDATSTGDGGVTSELVDYATTTASDHFDSSPAITAPDQRSPHWIDSQRLLVADPYGTGADAVSTWLESGADDARQGWFYTPDGLLQDGELSPDGSRLAITAAVGGAGSPYRRIWFLTTNAGTTAPPTPRCTLITATQTSSPSWSPASSALAYANDEGVWVDAVGDLTAPGACTNPRLLVAGGAAPDWGPADVDMTQRPTPPSSRDGTTAPAHTPAAAPTVDPPKRPKPSRVMLTAHVFRTATTLRFSLNAPGDVSLTVRRACRASARCAGALGTRHVRGHAGRNSIRLSRSFGRSVLHAGRYALTLLTAGGSARVRFEVTR